MKLIQSILIHVAGTIGALFFALLIWSRAGFGQARIDTTLGPSVRISILQPDFWYQNGQSNIVFRVNVGNRRTLFLNDSIYDLPWETFRVSDSISASSYFRAKPDAVPQGWTPWYRITLSGPVPVQSDIPFVFHPINFMDQGTHVTLQRGTSRPTVAYYVQASNTIAFFGTNFPNDTTGFWFVKSADRAGTAVINVTAKGELLNVTVNKTTKSVALINSLRSYSFEFPVVKGLNRFLFWTMNKSVTFPDPCFSVQWTGADEVPALPVVRIWQR
jgi:hypothetical protein